MPKVPKVNSFTTQPLNHLTTQLLSSFVVAQKLCMFIAKIKALREINDSDQAIGKNLRQPSLSPFLAFNKKTRYQACLITGLVGILNSTKALSGPVASFSLPYGSSTGN